MSDSVKKQSTQTLQVWISMKANEELRFVTKHCHPRHAEGPWCANNSKQDEESSIALPDKKSIQASKLKKSATNGVDLLMILEFFVISWDDGPVYISQSYPFFGVSTEQLSHDLFTVLLPSVVRNQIFSITSRMLCCMLVDWLIRKHVACNV